MIATHEVFREAIRVIEPLVVRTNGFRIVHLLDRSGHPEQHPKEALRLLDLLVEADAFGFGGQMLRSVLDRIALAAPELREDQSHRRWDNELRIRGQ